MWNRTMCAIEHTEMKRFVLVMIRQKTEHMVALNECQL